VIPEPLRIESLRERFRGRRFGDPIVYEESLASTNDLALELLDRGFPEGTLVLAEEQTQGRGRRGRSWSSPPRLGIYASLLLRPRRTEVQLPWLTFSASLGIARALEEVTEKPVEIKWPNDLLLEGRKVAGLLSEARTREDGSALAIGVGVNVHQAPADFPEEFRGRVISMRMASDRIGDRESILAAILARWEEEHLRLLEHGEGETLSRWESRSCLRPGDFVQADLGDELLRGLFRGLAPGGELQLELEGGRIRRIAFGDVRRLRRSE
jgi:BirA family biotin operon repressor/biotin-[acetyl-CoA-carboxylase] ligase